MDAQRGRAGGGGGGDRQSMAELVRALRADAEAVLRGVDALESRCPQDDEPPAAAGAGGGGARRRRGRHASPDGAPAAPGPCRRGHPRRQRCQNGSSAAAAPDGGGSHHALVRRNRGFADGVGCRKSITSWLRVPPALVSRWNKQPSRLPPPKRNGMRSSGPGSGPHTVLQLDSRWRDLFVSHELEMDNSEDYLQFRSEFSIRRNQGSSVKLALPQSPRLASLLPGANVPLLPHCGLRIAWDLTGLLLMLYDIITIPIYFCWDTQATGAAFVMVGLTAAFWGVDVLMNLNTGYFSAGVIEMSRRAVLWHYVKTWFLLDIGVVILDVMILQGSHSSLSSARAIRVLRLAKAAKMSRLNQAVQDVCASFGLRWLILVLAIVRNLTFIYLLAHVAACVWYLIGRIHMDQSLPAWLDLVDHAPGFHIAIYVRSLYWVLGHLTAAPVDPSIQAQSDPERLFTVLLVFGSLLVLGAAISSMNNTIDELSKLNSDFVETKRQLQSYLKTAGVHRELSTRIIQFALHSYKRRCALSLDAGVLSLLSERLKSELAMNQRSRYFLVHPLFLAIHENHLEVFRDVCEAFVPNVYADGDAIFNSGRVAKCLYVTHQGSFRMHTPAERKSCMPLIHITPSGVDSTPTGVDSMSLQPTLIPPGCGQQMFFEESEWICEISLYSKFVHQCTLQSVSFADAFTFSRHDLLHCVGMSPTCIGFIYRYAQEYVRNVQKPNSTPVELLSLKVAKEVFAAMQQASQPLTSELESPDADSNDTTTLLKQLRDNDRSMHEIQFAVPQVFKELDDNLGLFAKLLQLEERNRAVCSMLSIVMLVKDRYDDFTKPQRIEKQLSAEKWGEWQAFVQWVDITDEQLHAALVFLAIRGLGKFKSLGKSLPVDSRAPEDIVLHLIGSVTRMVPSVGQLSDEMRFLVQDALVASKRFSLPQLLQGENTPSQVQQLQISMANKEGETLLKFLLLCQVGVMCGLMGAKEQGGSAFMDEQNSANVLAAVSFLRMAGCADSHAVYWGYILSRGRKLGLPTEEPDHIAICRLACLCRTSPAEKGALQQAWDGLSISARQTLMDNLLADGMQEIAFVFAFLPLYMANAKGNRSVGLQRAFLVLVDLLEVLRVEGCAEEAGSYNMLVDLQEVAAFAKDVRNPRVFLATSAHVKLVQHGSEIQILIASKHKDRVKLGTWADDQDFDMPGVFRKLERKVDLLETYITESGVPVSGHEGQREDQSEQAEDEEEEEDMQDSDASGTSTLSGI